jgi:hypothetical protein
MRQAEGLRYGWVWLSLAHARISFDSTRVLRMLSHLKTAIVNGKAATNHANVLVVQNSA